MRIFFLGLSMVFLSCNGAPVPESRRPDAIPLNPVTKPLPYALMKNRIDSIRLVLRHAYATATDSAGRNKAIGDAKAFLLTIVGNDLYDYWQGTPWDFNGTSTVPKEGTIACGYFVTGLLQDAGYRLNRIKLSTCPSLTMMKELTTASAVKNRSLLKFDAFSGWIEKAEPGVYIAGLDFHTGFVVNDGKEAWFIHSNYIGKKGVVKERLRESAAFQVSKTRYITCLTKSEKFLRTWLLR